MKPKPFNQVLLSVFISPMLLLAGVPAQAAQTVSEQAVERVLIHGQETYPAAGSQAVFDVAARVEQLLVGRNVKPTALPAPETTGRAYAQTPERAAERLLTGHIADIRG